MKGSQSSKLSDISVNILIVEDDPAFMQGYKKALANHSFSILQAETAKKALSIAKECENIALIILDIQLPDMTGFALTEELRKIKHLISTPILFISGIMTDKKDIFHGYE